MRRHLYRPDLRSLLLTMALALAQSGAVLAQEPVSSALTTASGVPRPADPVETASLEHLPSLPVDSIADAVEPVFPAKPAVMAPMAIAPVIVPSNIEAQHRFWDRENRVLFATGGAFAAADFWVTHANLARGGKELNPVTRVFSGSTPGLAANFALETGSVVAIGYIFHKTGHHKLERITSFVNIGASASAVSYSLAHR